jgi:glycosyltransferase involved in cell wall biosynthesis
LWNEPLGRVAIEAMAHGIPTIASRRGGLVEIIENNSTGWLFDPSVEGELRELLVEVAEAPSLVKDMAIACNIRAADFLPAQIAKSYESVYTNACC